MIVCILILAGEGDTQEVFVGRSGEELIASVCTYYGEEVKQWNDDDQLNRAYSELLMASLCEMLTVHKDWAIGRHTVQNITPWWEEWTLVVVDLVKNKTKH